MVPLAVTVNVAAEPLVHKVLFVGLPVIVGAAVTVTEVVARNE